MEFEEKLVYSRLSIYKDLSMIAKTAMVNSNGYLSSPDLANVMQIPSNVIGRD